ncbi:hypothetical protein HG530_006366 [Fusarium avenaceum]|nr:hypothetical protein HG530_006366 [Fusarium avenaceum]
MLHLTCMPGGDILDFLCLWDTAFLQPGLRYLFLDSSFKHILLLGGLAGFPRLTRLTGLTLLTTTSSTTSSTSLAALSVALILRLVLTLLFGAAQVGNSQSLGKIDLSADSVGQVADHEDVLDVVVEVVLDLLGVDLGGKGESVEKVLADDVVRLLVLVQNTVDPLACPVEKVDGLLDRSTQTLDVRDKRGCSRLGVLCAGDSLESTSVGITVKNLVGDLDEETAFGSTLGVDGNGGADIASRLDILAGFGRDGHVNGRMGECAGVRRAEEVLDKGAEAVELVGGGVPAE